MRSTMSCHVPHGSHHIGLTKLLNKRHKFIVAGILALVGKKQVEQLKGPERTIAAIKAGPGIPLGAPESAAAEEGPNAPPAA